MQTTNQAPDTFDEVIADIAFILAQGYLRYRKSRQISPGSETSADIAGQPAESRAVKEKTT